jgi:hypothetical protein
MKRCGLDRFGYNRLNRNARDGVLDERVKDIMRGEHVITHFMPRGFPVAKCAFTPDIQPTEDDKRIARRLLNFYAASVEDQPESRPLRGSDLWTVIGAGPHADLIRVLKKNDAGELAGYLCNLGRSSATHGILQDTVVYQNLVSNEEARRHQVAFTIDKLVSLAEALRCLPYENPESGRWGVNAYTDVEELIDRIEKALGSDFDHPSVLGGLFGLDTSKGILDFRYISALYTGWRICQILKDRGDTSVCEIGAGIGFFGHACTRLGIKNYTIFDLPQVAVMSGYYLIKSLPHANVVLYGEEEKNGPSIKLYPFWRFGRTGEKCFDLTLNQDSFAEIDSRLVNWYLDSIVLNTKTFFLSINQEGRAYLEFLDKSELSVSELMLNRKGYELVYRFPYWMREGYTEELYKID